MIASFRNWRYDAKAIVTGVAKRFNLLGLKPDFGTNIGILRLEHGLNYYLKTNMAGIHLNVGVCM